MFSMSATAPSTTRIRCHGYNKSFQKPGRLGLTAQLLALPSLALAADTTTIGQLVTVAGAPSNQLYGYGLVVGLAGTGDQTTEVPYTQQAILNMLRNMGIALPNVSFMQPEDV